MATKTKKAAPKAAAPRKAAGSGAASGRTAPERAPHSEAYEAALRDYTAALELLRRGDFARARDGFAAVERGNPGEPELADRARMYATLCGRRLAPAAAPPSSAEDRYFQAIVRSNAGRPDEAVPLLDAALHEEPDSARYLYARASAHALLGRADAAVADLRRAITADPQLRYQASNDPDFERVRDDAAFIDVIEPTPAGA